jgi:hypothetical protein
VLTIITFYRNFIFPSLIITGIGCYFLVQAAHPLFLIYVFWMKVFTSFFLGLYFYFFRAHSLMFYHNLGFSSRQLYGFTFLIDFSIWMLASAYTIHYWL